jgi:hypothetical protein
MNNYSNLPAKKEITSSSDYTVRAFNMYYQNPIEISSEILTAMEGFFERRGFDKSASKNISVTIITQAKRDGYNPMSIMDTLSGLDNVEISALVSEILNYNRVKTSFLGYAQSFVTNDEILRNIKA